jgi:hypothetical protein
VLILWYVERGERVGSLLKEGEGVGVGVMVVQGGRPGKRPFSHGL